MNNEIITQLLTEIRDLLRENLTAANVLAERREKDRKRKRLVRGQTLTEKEEGKEAGEKEKSPLHPPKGKEGEEKGEEKGSTSSPRARVREGDIPLPPIIDVNGEPSLDLVLSFANRRMNLHDDDLIREWHRIVSEEWFWKHNKTGLHIQNWPAHLRSWFRIQKEAAAKQKKGVQYAARGRRLTANQSCIVDYDLPV